MGSQVPEKGAKPLDPNAVTLADTVDHALVEVSGSIASPTTSSPSVAAGAGSGPVAGRDDSTLMLEGPSIPVRIGRYQITRLIGSGGMGAVYEAVQDQPRRTVALKVMKSAVASPMALRRFEYESQLLAKLRHPGIAQVYDAGTHQDPLTMQAVPFFAMEYIPDARSLTAYAAAASMTLRQRLELFIGVCDAVHHGHQRGIIHRDIKPANILVDPQGLVKVIDFGVASSADADTGARATQQTRAGQLLGTLQYMAPEQCGPASTDIDSRADVYALGVTLYELLTGTDPYDLSGRSLVEAIRIIREVPPTAPSARPGSRELRGDVETIILKALAKEPERRYDSASAFAADLQRFLNSEPIVARRIGVPGRMARWVKRNRAVATVGAGAAVVLAVTTAVLATRIINENRRANAELARANDNMARIKEMFTAMTGTAMEKGKVNVERVFDIAAGGIDASPAGSPATEADFREFLAKGYIGLDSPAKAVEQQRRVVAMRSDLSGKPSAVLAGSLHELGRAFYFTGQYGEAIDVYTKSLEMRRALYGEKHPDVATSMTHLGACRLRQGRLTDAETLFRAALEMRREILPAGSVDTAASVNNFAKCVLLRGNSEEAEVLFRQALTAVVSALGESDLDTSYAAHNLGACQLERGRYAEARDHFKQALAIRSAKYPSTHGTVLASRLGLARATFGLGETSEALREALAVLSGLEQRAKADHPDIAAACLAIGRMHAELGEPKEAEQYLRRAVSIFKDPARATPWELAEARLQLATCLRALGRADEAEQHLIDSIRALANAEASDELRRRAGGELASLYDAQQRPDDAERVRRETGAGAK